MPLQIDGATVGEVRYARPDGTLTTIGEARVWDGQWRTIYTSTKSVTLRTTGVYQSPWEYVSGDLGLLNITTDSGPGHQWIEFHVPVTATHVAGGSAAVAFQPGEIIPAYEPLRTAVSPNATITFTEAT